MDNATYLGLDVHRDTIAVAILRPGETEPDERTIANTPEAVRALIRRGSFQYPVACYEAGPTGYETHRLLTSLDVRCDVVAPTMIPRRAGARVKTDRIDARNLARLHRAGALTPIRVPTPSEEAIRDLVRVREDIKDDRRKTQHRVKAFLLRQGRRYPSGTRAGATSSICGLAPSASTSPLPMPRTVTTSPRSTSEGPSSGSSPARSRQRLSCSLSPDPSPSSDACVGSRPSPR